MELNLQITSMEKSAIVGAMLLSAILPEVSESGIWIFAFVFLTKGVAGAVIGKVTADIYAFIKARYKK